MTASRSFGWRSRVKPTDAQPREGISAAAHAVAANLQSLIIDEGELEQIAKLLAKARQVLVTANGLSAPLGTTLVARLVSVGVPAVMYPDHTTENIAAAGLSADSVCVAISGSGVNNPTLRTVQLAHEAGADVVALTSFKRTLLTELATHSLIIPKAYSSFREEILHASRVELLFVCEQLAAQVSIGAAPKTDTLSIISEGLRE